MKIKAFDAVDMTVGTPWKQILRFTVPMLLGNVVQQLYSTVDSILEIGEKKGSPFNYNMFHNLGDKTL